MSCPMTHVTPNVCHMYQDIYSYVAHNKTLCLMSHRMYVTSKTYILMYQGKSCPMSQVCLVIWMSHVAYEWCLMSHPPRHTFLCIKITTYTYLFLCINMNQNSDSLIFICVPWLIHVCDMTHSCVRHDSFMCATWLIHVCDMPHSCVSDSFIFLCVTWLIHVCDISILIH